MASLNSIACFGFPTLLGLIAGAVGLTAAEPPMELVSVRREVPERGAIAAATMLQGKARHSFIVPAGWRVGVEDGQEAVLLQSAEYRGVIEIKRKPLSEGKVDLQGLRDEVARRENLHEMNYAWMGVPCRAYVFDVVETVGKFKQRSRICFMLRNDHLLVITLRAGEEQFASCVRAYEIILASLRQE